MRTSKYVAGVRQKLPEPSEDIPFEIIDDAGLSKDPALLPPKDEVSSLVKSFEIPVKGHDIVSEYKESVKHIHFTAPSHYVRGMSAPPNVWCPRNTHIKFYYSCTEDDVKFLSTLPSKTPVTERGLATVLGLFEREMHYRAKTIVNPHVVYSLTDARQTVRVNETWISKHFKHRDPATVKAIYDHWVKRRLYNRDALIPEFSVGSSAQNHSPYIAFRNRGAEATRRGGRHARINDIDSCRKLMLLGDDLQQLTALCGSVVKRETIKVNIALSQAAAFYETLHSIYKPTQEQLLFSSSSSSPADGEKAAAFAEMMSLWSNALPAAVVPPKRLLQPRREQRRQERAQRRMEREERERRANGPSSSSSSSRKRKRHPNSMPVARTGPVLPHKNFFESDSSEPSTPDEYCTEDSEDALFYSDISNVVFNPERNQQQEHTHASEAKTFALPPVPSETFTRDTDFIDHSKTTSTTSSSAPASPFKGFARFRFARGNRILVDAFPFSSSSSAPEQAEAETEAQEEAEV